MFCRELETTTRAQDVFELIDNFFQGNKLEWKDLCGVCSDGAPAMLGSRSGFQKLVKAKSPEVTGVHCVIHRQALACKTMPPQLLEMMSTIIKIVNFIKSSALNTRLFRELCENMTASHQTLLFYTQVRWLSKGNVLKRVQILLSEIKVFLDQNAKHEFLAMISDERSEELLAYLVNIFDRINSLNLSLQGKNKYIFDLKEKLNAYQMKLQNWKRKIENGNICMFEGLSEFVEKKDSELDEDNKGIIIEHLTAMEYELSHYFPECGDIEFTLLRNPFIVSPQTIPDNNDQAQDELIELINDGSAKEVFEREELSTFWSLLKDSYPTLTRIVLRKLLPFATTYLCESSFSTLLQLKTNTRNRLKVEDDLRCALSTTEPEIQELVKQKQLHPSH